MKLIKLFLPLLILVTLVESPFAKIKAGDIAPDFTLEDVRTGEQISLSSFKGQIVVLRIWKVCSGSCRTNVPVLNRIHSEYSGTAVSGDSKVKVISVNAINRKKRILNEMNNLSVEYQVLTGKGSGITSDYNTVILPQIYVIDAKGIIRLIEMYPDYEELKKVIDGLISDQ